MYSTQEVFPVLRRDIYEWGVVWQKAIAVASRTGQELYIDAQLCTDKHLIHMIFPLPVKSLQETCYANPLPPSDPVCNSLWKF